MVNAQLFFLYKNPNFWMDLSSLRRTANFNYSVPGYAIASSVLFTLRVYRISIVPQNPTDRRKVKEGKGEERDKILPGKGSRFGSWFTLQHLRRKAVCLLVRFASAVWIYRVAQNFGTSLYTPYNFVKYWQIWKHFHYQNLEKICIGTIAKEPSTCQICRYTT